MLVKKILVIIPARAGSKGVKNKNIRNFCGKPLIAYPISQALVLKKKGFEFRCVVSTEDKKIAGIAKKYGAEVPFFRPEEMARDNSLVMDAIVYTINKLEKDEGYKSDFLMILETTGPLREIEDIYECLDLIQRPETDAVATTSQTHSLLYHLDQEGYFVLVNKPPKKFGSKNKIKGFQRQAFPAGYRLNCCVNLIKTEVLLKEKTFFPKRTMAAVMDEWRAIDIDHPIDFILAGLLYRNKEKIKKLEKKFR